MKKVFGILSVFLMAVILFSACGKKDEVQPLNVTLSVKCNTILKNMDKLSDEKKDIIPENGIIIAETDVGLTEKSSLLYILKSEITKRKIHIDFESGAGSAYVKGMANIYAGDCGELSGWMVRVNGEDIAVGADLYYPKDGDIIEWLYTCDMGNDL